MEPRDFFHPPLTLQDELFRLTGDEILAGVYKETPKYPEIRPTPKSKLKPGYICLLRNGSYLMVLPTENCGMCLTGLDTWAPLDAWNSDLLRQYFIDRDLDVMKIFGYASYPMAARDFSSAGRGLIWERKETKKMTVKEICDALGYEVHIVKEGEM